MTYVSREYLTTDQCEEVLRKMQAELAPLQVAAVQALRAAADALERGDIQPVEDTYSNSEDPGAWPNFIKAAKLAYEDIPPLRAEIEDLDHHVSVRRKWHRT